MAAFFRPGAPVASALARVLNHPLSQESYEAPPQHGGRTVLLPDPGRHARPRHRICPARSQQPPGGENLDYVVSPEEAGQPPEAAAARFQLGLTNMLEANPKADPCCCRRARSWWCRTS